MWVLIALYLVGTVVATAVLQWLWNETMPELFRMPGVTYWQAFRLLLIAGILIGGPGLVQLHLGG